MPTSSTTAREGDVTPAPERPRILIADDEELVARLLARTLARTSSELELAHDGKDAIARIERTVYDLVVTDISMPGATGLEVTRAAKRRCAETAVIVITGNATLDTAVEALRAGAYDYLQKPFEDLKQVNRTVERALERQRLMRENARMVAELRAHTEQLEGMNRELRKAQSQLVQAGKMAALGQMAAGIAHEINNPLHFIIGDLYLVGRDIEHLNTGLEQEDEGAIRQVATDLGGRYLRMQDGVRRIQAIVLSLMGFSRPAIEGPAPLDVRKAIDGCLVILHSKYKDRIEIQREHAADLPSVVCLAGEINQVLMNVLDNAIGAIEDKGTITVRTRHDTERGTVVVSVQDTGSGIPLDVLAKIFDPFFTTKPPGKGTGLGLSISYGVVTRHEGRVWAESPVGPNGGTTFHVELPVEYRGQLLTPAGSIN
jgi:two-component system, NtrC family, sensor kinase